MAQVKFDPILGKLRTDDSLLYEAGYAGKAYTTTDPGTPTQAVFYICMENGTYTNFDGQDATILDRFYWNTGTSAWDLIPHGTEFVKYENTDPTTITTPPTGTVYMGTYNNKVWVMFDDGTVEYIAMESHYEYQSQAEGVEMNFRSDVKDDSGVYYPNTGSVTVAKLMEMGLWKKTKLLLTPAGTKAGTGVGDGKLYSIKGSDFTVQRNSKASYVDIDGYIRQAQADEARIDYADGKAAIKIEFQSTNKVLYPFSLEDVYWTKSGLSVDSSGFASPFKDTSGNILTVARKLVEDTGTTTHYVSRLFSSLTSGEDYAVQGILKGNGRNIQLQTTDGTTTNTVVFDLENGVVLSGAGEIEEIVDGYYKCSLIHTMDASQTDLTVKIMLYNGGDNYTGDGVSGIYVSGVQFEESPVATSFINDPEAVEGGEVSRFYEIIGLASVSMEGDSVTFFADIETQEKGFFNRILSLTDGSAVNRIVIRNEYTNYKFYGTIDGYTWYISDYPILRERTKIAISFIGTTGKLYINGILKDTKTVPNPYDVSKLNRFNMGDMANSGNSIIFPINSVAVFYGLSDQELIELTK